MPDLPALAKTLRGRAAKFVVEYCVDFSPTRAATAAGYKSSGACYALVKREDVREAIQTVADFRRQQQLDRAGTLIDTLWDTVHGGPVVKDEVKMKAADMLMRHYGLYKSVNVKHDISGTVNVNHGLSPEVAADIYRQVLGVEFTEPADGAIDVTGTERAALASPTETSTDGDDDDDMARRRPPAEEVPEIAGGDNGGKDD